MKRCKTEYARDLLITWRFLVVPLIFLNVCHAFMSSIGPQSITKKGRPTIGALHLDIGDGNLPSALTRLNQDFERNNVPTVRPTGNKQSWTKLLVDVDNASRSKTTTEDSADFVYLLEPPSLTPSLLILFIGGAGLGQFPHIAYSEFLTRISTKLNAAVIAAPYSVGLDHFELAKKSYSLLTRAISRCEEYGYSETMPRFLLGHSLGSKLLTLSLAASGLPSDASGVGMISFNNFGFRDTIGMMKSFVDQIDMGQFGRGIADPNPQVLDAILGFAEQAVDMTGLEFNPSPKDTEKIIRIRYSDSIQARTRMFVFEKDDLDCSQCFIDACRAGSNKESLQDLSISILPGEHLTPAYIKLSLNDLSDTIPEEARQAAGDIAGGFQSASFGDEDSLNALVGDICDWMMGKESTSTSRGARLLRENTTDD